MTAWSTTSMQMTLGKIRAAEREGAVKGLFAATEHVLQVAKTKAPIEEGTLERSGVASQDADSLTGAVSFDTPYAVRQHEEMGYKHDAGRTAKYLENAMNSERQVASKLIADSIRKEMGS